MSVSGAATEAYVNPWVLVWSLSNSLDTERAGTIWTKGRLSLFRLGSIGNEGLQTEFSTPFESAAAALLDLAG